MVVQVAIGIAFVLMAGSLAAVFVGVAFDGHTEAGEVAYQRGSLIRQRWFVALFVFAVVVFVISMSWLPYSFVRTAELGTPTTKVAVMAQQFEFKLSQTALPAGQTLEFDVGSKDVNHGFAIYDAAGYIVGQVQAMPGFTNVLVLQLAAGTYTLHCDELCGAGHPFMKGTFTVGATAGGSGGGAAACGGGGCGAGCAGSCA